MKQYILCLLLSLLTLNAVAANDPTDVTSEEREALKFLYESMVLADSADYTEEFWLRNVRQTITTREEMPWGHKVPPLLFRHFVLPLRVNNESLDDSREVFYGMLKGRVRHLSMKDAILEVNHWCHEHVTYQPSDARTHSPLQTLSSAIGRCGEESTFAVAALRAVGIPARQVYTPRWAHTDDNHAWVEAWADGQWYFLGACEPAAVLNLGWFNAPASRALLMHTRVFGSYDGPEEVLFRTPHYTEINLTSHYAPVSTILFRVVEPGEEGQAVGGARVEFKIYNYAEYYSAVTKYADDNGYTSLSAGRGDMMVWASKDGRYGWTKATFGTDSLVTIVLDHDGGPDSLLGMLDSVDIVPPQGYDNVPVVSAEMEKENNLRLAQEDSLRHAYEQTFYQGSTASPLGKYLKAARGNWRVIDDFAQKHKNNMQRVLALLGALSEKDLTDVSMEILEDNYGARSRELSPRVEDEMIISPFKQFFEKTIPAPVAQNMRRNPQILVDWVKTSIRLVSDSGSLHIPMTPVSVWRLRKADARSRDIFFVDLARSLGIEARKDAVTQKVQYKKGEEWVDVLFSDTTSPQAAQGTLLLSYEPTAEFRDAKYYSHFTLSKIVDGHAQLLNYAEDGVSWESTFKDGVQLDEGIYLLITGVRQADGSVQATQRLFRIEEGQTTTVPLVLRQQSDKPRVIGSFSSESRVLVDGKEVSLLSLTGRGYYALGVVAMGEEPSNHALRDIAKVRSEIDVWGRPLMLLFESNADLQKFLSWKNADGTLFSSSLPQRTILAVDKEGSVQKSIATQMAVANPRQLPLFILADTFDRVVFFRQGYTIGLGEQISSTVNKLQQ